MSEYKQGNLKVLELIRKNQFDCKEADILLNGVDINEPILDVSGFSTTYLSEAARYNNLSAVRYFLEKGADPNYDNEDLLSGTRDCSHHSSGSSRSSSSSNIQQCSSS